MYLRKPLTKKEGGIRYKRVICTTYPNIIKNMPSSFCSNGEPLNMLSLFCGRLAISPVPHQGQPNLSRELGCPSRQPDVDVGAVRAHEIHEGQNTSHALGM